MAWPFRNKQYVSAIDRLRRECTQFGVLHKYHDTPDAVDNDFFFVLGNIAGTPDDDRLLACQQDVREYMASLDLPSITLTERELKIVAYREGDTKFLEAEAFSLDDASKRTNELLDVYPTIA